MLDTLSQSEAQLRASHPGRTYRPDIDGLRAVAILAVVAYHAGIPGVGGGFVGVDIFFVISGYLITSVICSDIDSATFSITKFYARRAKRILPALFSVLLACYVLALVLLSPAEIRTFAHNAFATIVSASNVLFWLRSGYFAANADLNPLLMTWSLGVEEQFYLIFPVLMFLLSKFGKQKRFAAIAVLLFASFVLSVLGTRSDPTATFFLLPTRAWELAVGALIAMREAEKPSQGSVSRPWLANALSVFAMGMLAIAAFSYTRYTVFPGLAASLPVAGAALLVMTPSSWINRYILASKPMVFVGLISYSWYLLHWPLLSFARILVGQISVQAAVTIAVLSFLLAIASHRYIEQPFRRSSSDNPTILKRYFALALAMTLPLIVMLATHGWPARFPGLSQVEASGAELKTDRCLAQYGDTAPNLSAACAPEGPANVPGVALLGDSHAAALAGALRQLGGNSGFRLVELTKSSCPPLLDVTRLMPAHPRHDRECAQFNAKTLAHVQADDNIKIVILAGFWSAPFVHEKEGDRFIADGQPGESVSPAQSRANLKQGLQDTVEALRSSGKKVIVLKDNPMFDFDPVLRVRGSFIKPRMLLAKILAPTVSLGDYSEPRKNVDPTYDNEASAIIDSVASTDQAVTYDLKKSLCDESKCYFYDGKSLLYEDDQHLSLTGAERGLAGLEVTRPVSR
ncbi:MAG: acyltransferase family protein [Candidatus Acidiferrales bacterium]